MKARKFTAVFKLLALIFSLSQSLFADMREYKYKLNKREKTLTERVYSADLDELGS